MINTIEKAIKYLTFKRKGSNYSESNTDINWHQLYKNKMENDLLINYLIL